MTSEARQRAFQVMAIMAGVMLTVGICTGASGCRNPVTIEAAVSSPSGSLVAEVITTEVSWLTGKDGDRGFSVWVRKPQERRDFEKHVAVDGVGKGTAPSLKWVSEQALDVHVPPALEVTTKRNVAGVTVNVVPANVVR